jgi:hypothetical protein
VVLLLALTVAVVGAAGCGTKPKKREEKASATSSATETKAATGNTNEAGKSTTTTALKPFTKVKNRPDCLAYERFLIGLSGVAFSKPEQRAENEQKANELAADAKKALPQFASDIDTQLALTKKAITPGSLNQAEKEQLKKIRENLTEWKNTTCL